MEEQKQVSESQKKFEQATELQNRIKQLLVFKLMIKTVVENVPYQLQIELTLGNGQYQKTPNTVSIGNSCVVDNKQDRLVVITSIDRQIKKLQKEFEDLMK